MTPSEEQTLKSRATQLLATRSWVNISNNPDALVEMQRRAENRVGRRILLPYSNLFSKIDFNVSAANGASTYRIDVDNWLPSDGAFIGEFLDYLSLQSCEQDANLLSAHIVGLSNRKPGPGFFQLGRELGLFGGKGTAIQDKFWKAEMGYLFEPKTKSKRIIPFA